jgi:hypothetical protein
MTKEDLLIGYSNTIIYDSEGNVIDLLSCGYANLYCRESVLGSL